MKSIRWMRLGARRVMLIGRAGAASGTTARAAVRVGAAGGSDGAIGAAATTGAGAIAAGFWLAVAVLRRRAISATSAWRSDSRRARSLSSLVRLCWAAATLASSAWRACAAWASRCSSAARRAPAWASRCSSAWRSRSRAPGAPLLGRRAATACSSSAGCGRRLAGAGALVLGQGQGGLGLLLDLLGGARLLGQGRQLARRLAGGLLPARNQGGRPGHLGVRSVTSRSASASLLRCACCVDSLLSAPGRARSAAGPPRPPLLRRLAGRLLGGAALGRQLLRLLPGPHARPPRPSAAGSRSEAFSLFQRGRAGRSSRCGWSPPPCGPCSPAFAAGRGRALPAGGAAPACPGPLGLARVGFAPRPASDRPPPAALGRASALLGLGLAGLDGCARLFCASTRRASAAWRAASRLASCWAGRTGPATAGAGRSCGRTRRAMLVARRSRRRSRPPAAG